MTTGAISGQEVADYLDEAADVLERDGWIQEYSGNSKDGWCALGALSHAYMNQFVRDARTSVPWAIAVNQLARTALFDHLRTENPELPMGEGQVGTIAGWNDAPDRTADDVVTALRKTALSKREQA